MKQLVVKIIVASILLLLVIPSLAGLAVCLAENSLVSHDAFRATALESGWVEGVRQKVRQDFEPLNDVSGVPTDVTDAFLEEKLTEELCAFFWDGSGASFPKEELVGDLAERIRLCAAKMRDAGEIYVTDEEWEEILKNAVDTATYFVDAIRMDVNLRGMGAYAESLADHWQKLYPILVSGCAVLALGGILVLWLIFRKRVFTYLYAAFFGAGLVILAPVIWLIRADLAGRLQVGPFYLKDFLIRLYETACHRSLIAGIVLAALGLLFGVLALILHFTRRPEAEEKEEGAEYDTEILG